MIVDNTGGSGKKCIISDKQGKKKTKAKLKYAVGTTVSKVFYSEDDGEDRLFFGEVISYDYDEKLYSVKYEDGDEEEIDEGGLSTIVDTGGSGKKQSTVSSVVKQAKRKEASKKEEKAATKKPRTSNQSEKQEGSGECKKNAPEMLSTGRTPRRSANKKVVYYAESDSEFDVEESEEDVPKKRKKHANGKAKGKLANGKGKKKKQTTNSDDFMPTSEPEEDESFAADSESEMEAESEEEDYAPRKGKKGGKKSATSKKQPAGSVGAKKGEAKQKMKMSDMFKPTNNPIFWNKKMSSAEIQKNLNFLDPCGMEATDDIIDRLVGEQLDKIGNLLKKALTAEDVPMLNNAKMQKDMNSGKEVDTLGSHSNPLILGTACSGTDAPALALMLVQEQLEKRGMGNLFNHDHVFSCEKEPFKQSYLARNFDSVLYPDIVKLCDDPPRDVYGQEKPIPQFNMFVAGTSCKNFSMLMANKRLDIEDKGCSGETFLAACELLFKEKPRYAIFENVTGAPWAKMSEYITGRINLSECATGKKISSVTSKGKDGDLEFILEGDTIQVDRVPSNYGVRCGAIVEGYSKFGSTIIHEVSWPSKSKKRCTLAELAKLNGIDREKDILILENEVLYCTHWLKKVDTKNYGLPQTRERTYMFVWRPDDDNFDDDLGVYWEAIVKYLGSPVRHSLESFILEVDHDIIRTFREALNGPAGRYTMRGINKAPDFWDKKSGNANLPHNVNVRKNIGMEDLSRTQTNWGPFGKMHVPPHWWLGYMKCTSQRHLDMIEILHASAARDAESKDSNFSSFFWNISQNASREKHRSAVPGIASCITPGGDVFLPHAGRPLLGCEKLLLQGIPYFRLLLGNETEVQLGDLAGNAMSLTVVSATLLAAMTCKQLRKNHEESMNDHIIKTLKSINERPAVTSSEKLVEQTMVIEGDTEDTTTLFNNLAEVADAAIKSSIWCTCETSGRQSRSTNFLRCGICSVACCRDCVHVKQGYQLDSHDIQEKVNSRPKGDFEMKLRSLMPPNLILSKNGLDEVAGQGGASDTYRVAGLSGYIFGLHRIKRSRFKWIAVYYARDGGIGEAVAEFKIAVGELEGRNEGTDPVIGVQGELTSFFPAKKEPIVLGVLSPCAMVRQCQGDSALKWTVKAIASKTSLSLVGNSAVPSFRLEVGLTDLAANSLKDHATSARKKEYAAAKANGDQRRWIYPNNYREWPEEIVINDSRESNGNVICLGGGYLRAGCKQTFNQNACWIRSKTDDAPELYLLIKPDVSRVGPDVGIISTSTNHDDVVSILATLPQQWQPCDALNEKMQEVKATLSNWIPLQNMKCFALNRKFTVESPKSDNSSLLIKMNGLSDSDMTDLSNRDDASGSEPVVHLNVHRGAKAQQTVRRLNLLCIAPFLKYAAAHGLKYSLELDASWMLIEPQNDIPFGCCTVTLPPRPKESWSFNRERGEWERQSEPGASRKYFVALQMAPPCFDVVANRKEASLAVNCYPEVAAHHATFGLIEGRGNGIERGVSVKFRLLTQNNQEDPVLERFRLHNCHDLPETSILLKKPFELYERQAQAVTKMLRVEKGEVEFDEIEMSEHELSGSMGWSLIAKASRTTNLRGGVIADAIGAGKTVISIAIILQGIKAARANRSFPRKSSATLVVVPPGLIDQWKREINKFTSAMPKVICIYDDNALNEYSLQEFIDADVVICPVDILEATHYMGRLARVSTGSSKNAEVPKLPSQTGQAEKNGASGVWIPASSADPYGGANNPRNQQRRNESAYFTHVYHSYIRNIRQKKFKPQEKGIPLEYFEWERVFVDEIHECLCTSKDELKDAKSKKDKDSGFFQEKNRRAGREFLGITTKNISNRPIVFRKAIFGLTATPLLDSTNRVIELANLMGNAYVIGLSNHWRNLEKESGRDIFLTNFLEPKQSREIRKNTYAKCQDYLDLACCKNKNEEDMEGIELVKHEEQVRMSEEEAELYKKSQSGINSAVQSFAIKPEDFDVTAGHDVSKFLRQNAKLACRGKKMVEVSYLTCNTRFNYVTIS